MKKIWVLTGLLIAAGCSEEGTEYETFLDRTDQQATERVVSGEPETEASVNLSDYEIYSAGNLAANSTHLFMVDYGRANVVRVSKTDLSDIEVWDIPEGEGPGEVQIVQAVGPTDEHVYIGDPRSMKLVKKDTDGHHLRDISAEFSPGNFVITRTGRIINQSPVMQENQFVIYHPQADSLYGFEEGQVDIEESMKYSGYLSADGEALYYGGYSEPVLRKYSLEGDLLFSRSTIDNIDTRDNYQDYSSDEFRAFGFSEDARYSTYRLDVSGDELFVIPFHNGESGFRYLDIYDAQNGEYRSSLRMDYFPRDVIAEGDYIFTLTRDEQEEMWICRYPRE